jgi:hypothetical protein
MHGKRNRLLFGRRSQLVLALSRFEMGCRRRLDLVAGPLRAGSLAFACGLALAGSVGAGTYQVGPGQPLATPSDVPWELLAAGDVVRIHWRETAYANKWVVNAAGTVEAPVIVQGVPGPNGELPVIDGNGATTRLALSYWSEQRGVIKVGGSSTPNNALASHVVIENLEIRGVRPPYSFSDDDGATLSYPNNAAAIFVESGDHITIRNCILRDCGNGLFVAAASSNVMVEGNYIYDNGNVGSIYEHNSYTAAAGITFQFNRYGPLRAGAGGNNLKDRSAGTVIRYNWIESGNRQLDLVDAEDNVALQQDPRYRSTFVYGNVLIEPDAAGNRQIIHYGGDSGNEPAYRKGTLYLHHNTIVSTRVGRTTLLRFSTNDESADCRNNLIYLTDAGNQLELISDAGALTLNNNWLKPGWVNSFASGYTGSVTGGTTSITETAPGFINFAQQNLRLANGSACIDAGTTLHPMTLAEHAPVAEYRKHGQSAGRRTSGVADVGAFEFSPFAAWRGERFGDEAENDQVSGEGVDPDGDGLHNLVEYAFDLDPHVASTAGLPQPVLIAANGAEQFAVEFRRRPIPSGLIYVTAVTDDFITWSSGCEYSDNGAALPTAWTSDASDATWTRVRLNTPLAGEPHRFISVSVRQE